MDRKTKGFGTAPVFFTAISTILGAILFLRFGFATGTLGFWGIAVIILLGHMVTVPTALAISEIATNKRVEGGGEYFIISRSFGLNIGATIGIALFFSQAISVAFYIIAFTESFQFLFDFLMRDYGINLPRQAISIPAMAALALLIYKKGAGVGVKTLYIVVAILFVALGLFFAGSGLQQNDLNFFTSNANFRNMNDFFFVFAIVFPAFTGMTAGVGLSGELKKPSRSIPMGTVTATFAGMLLYFIIAFKLAWSAPADALINDQFVMGKIALGGAFIIPLGLAASTISSAIGSILVAPRTLQALAMDNAFPWKITNDFLSKSRASDGEPVSATLVTVIIAFAFVAMGNVNAVAEVISMFFMLTYGSLCLISFLNHFGSSPSYRPSFRSRWPLSLMGFLVSVWVMFKINTIYALAAILLMAILYIYLNSYHKERKGLADIFTNALYQLNRNLQVFLQKKHLQQQGNEWRPSAICISGDSFKRNTAFMMLNWISYKYGFGTYLHRIEGYYSKSSSQKAHEELKRLINVTSQMENHVYIDTIVSPSYTSAIAQSIQIPGISGMENNMIIFEYDKDDPKKLDEITENFSLVHAGNFDVCILATSSRQIQFQNGIHIWIKSTDTENANLMILLSFIILGHPDWKKGDIKIFEICKQEKLKETRQKMEELVVSGRLPITSSNIQLIVDVEGKSIREQIIERSRDAGLTFIGFREESLRHDKAELFSGYEEMGSILFVNSQMKKLIE